MAQICLVERGSHAHARWSYAMEGLLTVCYYKGNAGIQALCIELCSLAFAVYRICGTY